MWGPGAGPRRPARRTTATSGTERVLASAQLPGNRACCRVLLPSRERRPDIRKPEETFSPPSRTKRSGDRPGAASRPTHRPTRGVPRGAGLPIHAGSAVVLTNPAPRSRSSATREMSEHGQIRLRCRAARDPAWTCRRPSGGSNGERNPRAGWRARGALRGGRHRPRSVVPVRHPARALASGHQDPGGCHRVTGTWPKCYRPRPSSPMAEHACDSGQPRAMVDGYRAIPDATPRR